MTQLSDEQAIEFDEFDEICLEAGARACNKKNGTNLNKEEYRQKIIIQIKILHRAINTKSKQKFSLNEAFQFMKWLAMEHKRAGINLIHSISDIFGSEKERQSLVVKFKGLKQNHEMW